MIQTRKTKLSELLELLVLHMKPEIIQMVPTDLILVLRNEDDLDVLKKNMISYFKKKSFTVDVRTISGGKQSILT